MLIETDHRQIWQTFAEQFYWFRSTPTGVWLNDEMNALATGLVKDAYKL